MLKQFIRTHKKKPRTHKQTKQRNLKQDVLLYFNIPHITNSSLYAHTLHARCKTKSILLQKTYLQLAKKNF